MDNMANKRFLSILLKKVNEIANRKDFVPASYTLVKCDKN